MQISWKINWYLTSSLIIVIGIVGYGILNYVNGNVSHSEYHLHAGFKVFLDDKPVDFSASKYMYFQPCGLPSSQQKALQDKVHLHDRIGDVVHVHAEGVKWDDLFTSLKYEIPKNKNLSFYVDGIKTGDLLNTIIKDNQSVIIVIDGKKEDKEYLKDKVSFEKIEKVAKTKENCGE
jgi:hypothetical protein